MASPGWAEPFLTGGRTYAPQGVDAKRVVLDRQSFVWVTGENGTFRFDGVRYLPATRLGLPGNGATQIAITSDGTVWAQAYDGLYRLEGERFQLVEGVPQQPIAAAGEVLYTAATPGQLKVWFRSGSQWTTATVAQGPVAGVRLHGEADGTVWYSGAASSANWVRWRDGRVESGTETLRSPLLPQTEVVPVNNDLLFTASATHVLRFRRHSPGQMELLSATPTGVPIGSRVLSGDSRELRYEVCGIWPSPTGPAMRLSGVREMAPDRQAGWWAARGEQGLLFIGHRSGVRIISHREFPDRPVRAVARHGSRLYVARVDASAVLEEGQPVALCDQTSSQSALLRAWGLPGEQAPYLDVDVDPDGSVWVLARNHGAVHLSAEGKWIETAEPKGDPGINFHSSMREMTFSPDGRLWIASKRNLIEVIRRPLGYRTVFPEIRYTSGFVRDRANRLFAITEGGLSRYDAGEWRENPWPDCMLSPRVRTVAIASEAEQWIGYRDQLGFTHATRANSGTWTCQHLTAANGFPGDTQFLAFDRQQRLWRGSDQGLFVARTPPNAVSDWVRLGTDLGVPTGEMRQLFHEEPDGSVLVAIGDRFVKIPPRLLDRDAGGLPQVSFLEDRGRLTLQPGTIRTRLGNGAQLLLSAIPERELAAPAPLEYRWDADGWTPLAGHQLALDEAPRGVTRLQLRYAGAAAALTLPFHLEVPWFRSLWFQMPALMALLAGLVAGGRPLVRRWRFQASKRRFLATHPEPSGASEAAADWSPGTLVHDRYRIEGLLARGGFSDVFAAVDSHGRRVVVKRLRQDDLPVERLRRRFAQEIASVSMVQHEGILPILDTWIGEDGVPHLVLPRVDGPTLRQRLNTGSIARTEGRTLLRQLASIVAAAHAQGVVHSDLKPENILLRADGKPVVIDFGTSALHMQAPLSEYSRPAGSVQYMAPEQLLGRYSRATDVYALALVAVEVLTGRRFAELVLPFDEQWETAARQALVNELGFRPEAAAVLTEGLRFDPQQRAQDIADWQTRFDAQL